MYIVYFLLQLCICQILYKSTQMAEGFTTAQICLDKLCYFCKTGHGSLKKWVERHEDDPEQTRADIDLAVQRKCRELGLPIVAIPTTPKPVKVKPTVPPYPLPDELKFKPKPPTRSELRKLEKEKERMRQKWESSKKEKHSGKKNRRREKDESECECECDSKSYEKPGNQQHDNLMLLPQNHPNEISIHPPSSLLHDLYKPLTYPNHETNEVGPQGYPHGNSLLDGPNPGCQTIPNKINPHLGAGYPQMGMGYPQAGAGYPQMGVGYPQMGAAYPQMGAGYPQMGVGSLQTGAVGSQPNVINPL